MEEEKATTITHREQINSAVGTWSGFIYQGLCGILVALRLGTVGKCREFLNKLIDNVMEFSYI